MGGCASVNRKREGHVRVSSISMFNMPIYSIDYKNNCILKYSESNFCIKCCLSVNKLDYRKAS